MADVTAHVGDTGRTTVVLTDRRGLEGAKWDEAQGAMWETSHPEHVEVDDNDMNPLDAEVRFVQALPEGETATITFTCDSLEGAEVNELMLRSGTIEVLPPEPGQAVSGELMIELFRVDPNSPS